MRFRLASVLGKALDLARSVLHDLEADQIPAKLRKVAAHAGDLTPPLAERLAREIDRLDWLRERAVAAWPEADPSAEGPERPSALFLVRPEGWAADLIKAVGESAAAAGTEAAGRGDRLARGRAHDLMVAKDKVKALQKTLDSLRSELGEERRARLAPERARRAAESKEAAAEGRAADQRAAETARLVGRIEALQAELEAAREEARGLRRARAEAAARLEEMRSGGAWADRSPVELARHLDDLMAQARRAAAAGLPEPDGHDAPVLPPGVRPDTAEAIDSVLRLPGRVGVVVDGYNAGLAFGEGSPPEVRSRLEDLLRRIRTLGGPSMTLTVVWDSASEEPVPRRPNGLDVRFAPPGVPADDVVVAIATDSRRCVVITNDRDVRERAERTGALALWSDALVAWERRR